MKEKLSQLNQKIKAVHVLIFFWSNVLLFKFLHYIGLNSNIGHPEYIRMGMNLCFVLALISPGIEIIKLFEETRERKK